MSGMRTERVVNRVTATYPVKLIKLTTKLLQHTVQQIPTDDDQLRQAVRLYASIDSLLSNIPICSLIIR